MARKINPKTFDYNRDGERTDEDREFQVKDYNADGNISDAEEQKYNQAQGATRTEYEYDSEGNVVSQKTVSLADYTPPKKLSGEEMGYSQKFLEEHPDVKKKLELAIKFNWSEQKFLDEVETDTDFGRKTTASQAAFALGIAGKDAEEWQKKISTNAANVRRAAQKFGISLSEKQVQQFATNIVRNELTDTDVYAMLSREYEPPAANKDAVGETGRIADQIKNMANQYGVALSDESVQSKVREALKQGTDWQSWVEGQRDVFRNQAKTLYPKISKQLDNFTVADIMEPYLNDASELLGIRKEQMNISDTNDSKKWIKALTGGADGPMDRDQWIRTLRTDKVYGYQYTNRARNEAAELADEITSLFGMA